MKNALSYLLITSLLLCLTACGSHSITVTEEYQFLNDTSLPIGYSLAENPEGGYLIYSGRNVIGGIQLLDLTEAKEADPYLYQLSDHLIAAAEEITKQNNPAEYDHITQSSEYAYIEIDFVSADGATYRHYIIETDSGYCDIWFDQSQIAPDKTGRFIMLLFG